MKLFQNLLVASTALGVLTPIAAQASEAVNLEAMNSYRRSSSKVKKFDSNTFAKNVSEDIATLNGLVDGLATRVGRGADARPRARVGRATAIERVDELDVARVIHRSPWFRALYLSRLPSLAWHQNRRADHAS